MNSSEWDHIAERYKKIEDARLARVFPTAIERIRGEAARETMDYGCGDGQFAERCLSAGVERITIYDPTKRMRELAVARLGRFKERVRLAVEQSEIPIEAFDAATMMAVWMCLPTREACVECLSTIRNSLRKGGLLVAAVTHPCFRDKRFATFRTSFDMGDYAREGLPFQVTMSDGRTECEFTDYHWSLGEMSRQLRDARLSLEELIEIPDARREESPLVFPWLILCARRS